MKEIMAVIRMNMVNQTKKALSDNGVDAFFAREATGRGKGLVSRDILEGAEKGYEEAVALLGDKGRLYPKRVLTIVVPDEKVDTVVKTIMKVNITGKPGDGKIFVMPVADSVRVRTGESGNASIE
ncbi:P-II family nitrogen regulator [Oceanidesulfovibrio indonesiensis]|uniref:P-II family nitrogen regulator n=1 Tax=Oceanidesulfovibrio indonesiensis TaxID=54767 RepID=A0A7M3MDY1_9BACT|nr:P-II family nitrogen regulator [Oceanidesulfovibrio indonesiensis]TVM16567.1 P-II family nitrogen regulator [Oceanidesulfovibrio indonesiensis]